MNCNDIEQLMPEYLAGELEADQVMSMEAHVASCKRCREEVQSLKSTLVAMQAMTAPSTAEAGASTAGLEIRSKVHWSRRVLSGVARYAAVLVIGIGFGYFAGESTAVKETPDPVQTVRPQYGDAVHPGWIEAGIASSRQKPGQSSFTRNLTILSRVQQGH